MGTQIKDASGLQAGSNPCRILHLRGRAYVEDMMKDHEENLIPFEDSGIFPGKRKMLLKARNSKGREKAHLET